MNRRATGVMFCGIAAFLYAAKYISAAIFGLSTTTWSKEIFSNFLQYTGSSLTIISIISLVIGIIYVIIAEIKNNKNTGE